MNKHIKTYEEYRYFPWTVDPGTYDRNEPYWVWQKKKYKEEKLKKKATFGDIPLKNDSGTTMKEFSVSETAIVIRLSKINEILKSDNLSESLIAALKKIKEVTITYEQTDDYPPCFLTFDNLTEEDLEKLEKFGFDITEDNGKKRVAWRWK